MDLALLGAHEEQVLAVPVKIEAAPPRQAREGGLLRVILRSFAIGTPTSRQPPGENVRRKGKLRACIATKLKVNLTLFRLSPIGSCPSVRLVCD